MRVVKLIREIARAPDALAAPIQKLRSVGVELDDPLLRNLLARAELGTWAVDRHVLRFLHEEIERRRPRVVLEFGSGISTICLARFLSFFHDDGAIFSIDQDRDHLEHTRVLLGRAGLSTRVHLHHSPLRDQMVEGHPTRCFDLTRATLDQFFGGQRPEWIFVDGPAGENARFGTLPLVKHHVASPCHFVLDDGLRDAELGVAERWARLSGFWVGGIYAIGKGVVVGALNSPMDRGPQQRRP